MDEMATAYVLINCEIGAEQKVIDQIKPFDGIVEVKGVFGAYDILAKIETTSIERLQEIITWRIRKIDRIRSTLTLMGVEGQE